MFISINRGHIHQNLVIIDRHRQVLFEGGLGSPASWIDEKDLQKSYKEFWETQLCDIHTDRTLLDHMMHCLRVTNLFFLPLPDVDPSKGSGKIMKAMFAHNFVGVCSLLYSSDCSDIFNISESVSRSLENYVNEYIRIAGTLEIASSRMETCLRSSCGLVVCPSNFWQRLDHSACKYMLNISLFSSPDVGRCCAQITDGVCVSGQQIQMSMRI